MISSFGIVLALALAGFFQATAAAAQAMPAKASTADHGKFKALQQTFKTGPEVTRACLSCHTEAAKQIQHTKHWTWQYTDPASGKKLGKRSLINNFCTSTISNEKDCMACHAGYGWKDASFDFSKEENVDCLVCHDTTGTYRKLPGDAGHPVYERKEFPRGSGRFVEAVNLAEVAQKIGRPSRTNCGACHFNGAGADGAKHGDLDSSLKNPGRYLDVHMDAKGLNFACTTCHVSAAHEIAGSRYQAVKPEKGGPQVRGTANKAPTSCPSCHGNRPHTHTAILNNHTDRVACQTCHIPQYARTPVGTEQVWDWSLATEMGPEGKPALVRDSAGRRAFDSKKGRFAWDSYLVPEYRWFNGRFEFKALGDKIDATQVVPINQPVGSAKDSDSRIWPMKVHRGKQAYDKVNNYLVVAHTAGEDDDALWQTYDWPRAIRAGMAKAGLPFSGEYGFARTQMSWPITHMVAPKKDAVPCGQCHMEGGRLAGIDGVYIPARDRSRALDMVGWAAIALAAGGGLLHGLTRIVIRRRKKEGAS